MYGKSKILDICVKNYDNNIKNEYCCNPDCKHLPAHNKVLVKTNRKVYCIYCLLTNYIHPDKNGTIIPDNIYPTVSNINNNLTININNGTINNNIVIFYKIKKLIL